MLFLTNCKSKKQKWTNIQISKRTSISDRNAINLDICQVNNKTIKDLGLNIGVLKVEFIKFYSKSLLGNRPVNALTVVYFLWL